MARKTTTAAAAAQRALLNRKSGFSIQVIELRSRPVRPTVDFPVTVALLFFALL